VEQKVAYVDRIVLISVSDIWISTSSGSQMSLQFIHSRLSCSQFRWVISESGSRIGVRRCKETFDCVVGGGGNKKVHTPSLSVLAL